VCVCVCVVCSVSFGKWVIGGFSTPSVFLDMIETHCENAHFSRSCLPARHNTHCLSVGLSVCRPVTHSHTTSRTRTHTRTCTTHSLHSLLPHNNTLLTHCTSAETPLANPIRVQDFGRRFFFFFLLLSLLCSLFFALILHHPPTTMERFRFD
jgi:hypothetical protein